MEKRNESIGTFIMNILMAVLMMAGLFMTLTVDDHDEVTIWNLVGVVSMAIGMCWYYRHSIIRALTED